MEKLKTHYDNLKVARNAPNEVIRAAYKVLCQKYHPDKNKDDPKAHNIMKIINEAYDVLSDPVKRKKHDEWIYNQEKKFTSNVDSKKNDTDEALKKAYEEAQKRAHEETKRNYQEQAKRKAEEELQKKSQEVQKTKVNTSSNTNIVILTSVIVLVVAALIIFNSEKNQTNLQENIDHIQSSVENFEVEENLDEHQIYPTSFDCKKAKSVTEKLICRNEKLAKMDLELADKVSQARNLIADKKALNQRLRRQWNYREKNCKDEACLLDWFSYQTNILSQIIESGNPNIGLNTKQVNPEPLPVTGSSNRSNLEGVSPLQIKTEAGDEHYLVKIEDALSHEHVVSYFIRSGDQLNINLPLGTYLIKYAYGKEWYGMENLFGEETKYAQAEHTFNFTFDGYQYNGYTIELIKQINGNLQTSNLEKNQF